MSLTTGTKLGPHEIDSPIGGGGMGEVYLARDIDRDVAIKVLPETMTRDKERVARFDHESDLFGVAVSVEDGLFHAETPRLIFDRNGDSFHSAFDPTPDGKRFMLINEEKMEEEKSRQPIMVVNWFDELVAKMPAGAKR